MLLCFAYVIQLFRYLFMYHTPIKSKIATFYGQVKESYILSTKQSIELGLYNFDINMIFQTDLSSSLHLLSLTFCSESTSTEAQLKEHPVLDAISRQNTMASFSTISSPTSGTNTSTSQHAPTTSSDQGIGVSGRKLIQTQE